MSDDETLRSIRLAYRYVVAYERRVLDAMSALNTEVIELGFSFWRWEPQRSELPKVRHFIPEKSAWDLTPLYHSRFVWSRGESEENRAGNSWLFVDHIADTGIEQHSAPTKTEPDALRHLPSADQCDSLLRGRWLHLGKPVAEALWVLNWDDVVEKHFGQRIEDVWPTSPTASPVAQTLAGVTAGGHTISIAMIEGPEDFRARFVDPIMSALRQLPSTPVG